MRQLEAMVENQIKRRGITEPAVIAAITRVERHRFVLPGSVPSAYCDFPLPIGCGQTISQPYIVALMTELLRIAPEHRVLEIGTGSGYQAAILAELAAEVFTVEIIPELADNAHAKLKSLGYSNIRFKCGNGRLGWPEAAPFDGIIVAAAAESVPGRLKEQLKIGGRMVIPVGPPGDVQQLEVITRTDAGFKTEPDIYVRFVPLTGKSPPDE